MTPLERLLAEELPTGTFGDARPAKPLRVADQKPAGGPDPRAAEHRAELLAALDGFELRRPARHLHAVPDTRKAAA